MAKETYKAWQHVMQRLAVMERDMNTLREKLARLEARIDDDGIPPARKEEDDDG